MPNKKKDAYEKFAAEFKNETEFEEELDAEDLDPKVAEEEHFEIEKAAIEDDADPKSAVD
jgi:hypothetical protein